MMASSESREKQQPAPLFVTGVGASAGGLEALRALVSKLPADSGMTFLVVQHLDPGHSSMLTTILGKISRIPVMEACDGENVVPNHIYVIPPNSVLTIADNRLHLGERDRASSHPPKPIDDLLFSLARDKGEHAVGVILSGAGSDGAKGMKAIREAGGTLFAQDETARFPDMPQAARSHASVHFVGAPEEIAQELVRLGQEESRLHAPYPDPNEAAFGEESLRPLLLLLHTHCNVDFTLYKRSTIKRRLARRLAMHRLEDIPAYMTFLEEHPDEIPALCQDLLICVTSFFRDPDSFDELSRSVLPRLIGTKGAKASLRIWVPGCSSGEEVYSIAICLMEYLGESAVNTQLQIFGTDVSEPLLAVARAGIYDRKALSGVSEQRLKRFFVKINGRYQIAKSIRNLCVFSRHDVAHDPPFSRLDLISCRNLLIYLDPVLQKRVITLFHYALNAGGVLMLGPSETVGGFSDLFSTRENKQFYTKNGLPTRAHLRHLDHHESRRKSGPKRHAQDQPVAADGETQRREADRIALSRYAPAGVLCDADLNILEFRGDTSPYLLQPSGPPNASLRKLARPGLLVDISDAVEQVRKDRAPARRTAKRVDIPGGGKVNIEVIPIVHIAPVEGCWFLISFEKAQQPTFGLGGGMWAALWSEIRGSLNRGRRSREREIAELKQELDATRNHMRALALQHEDNNEELKAAQEELLSSNEEFQSTNEELETAKEELQSSNEELTTTNAELQHRNTELSDINDKLNDARDYAEAIVETLHEPLLVLDGNLRIVRANTAFYERFKLRPERTEDKLLYELGNRQWDIPELRKLLEDVLPKDTSFQNFEITAHFPKRGERTILLNGRHLNWEGRGLILLAIEDVTDQKRAFDFLREESRLKDEFLAMLAHELRNPLAPIRNALEIWRRGNAGAEAEKEAQAVMERQLQKEVRLVDDLLDVSRITRGSIALKKAPVDLVQTVQQAVEGTRHVLESRQHELVVKLPEKSLVVEGDAVRLEQIVSNLLTNAAKYTDTGGRIALTLNARERTADINVTDNGIGIDPKLLPHVFNLFVQASTSLDRAQGGLGIGLTLVRRLVELQGGTVEAQSDGLGKGSTFVVHLPVAVGKDPPPAAAVQKPEKELPSKARRILVVDDNVDSAKTSALLLQLEGHEVRTVFDGPSAIKEARNFKPQVVLLDIGLPGMSGYEVARALRDTPETRSSLLMAVTGYGKAEDRRLAREAGFDHHLVKPFEMTELRARILVDCTQN